MTLEQYQTKYGALLASLPKNYREALKTYDECQCKGEYEDYYGMPLYLQVFAREWTDCLSAGYLAGEDYDTILLRMENAKQLIGKHETDFYAKVRSDDNGDITIFMPRGFARHLSKLADNKDKLFDQYVRTIWGTCSFALNSNPVDMTFNWEEEKEKP